MTYDTYKRAKPRLHILAGYGGNEPDALKYNAAPLADEAIKSGMVISLNGDGKWIKGCPAGKVPHIALQDQSDTDVISAGLLTGLSCLGKYRFQLVYLDPAITWAQGDPLIADGSNLGSVTKGTTVGSTGDILGYVTSNGMVDLAGVDSSASLTSGHLYAIEADTQFTPNRR